MPPFWKRVFVLPFDVRLMAEARRWPVGATAWPLVTLSLLLGLSLGLYRGVGFVSEFKKVGASYDARFDPLVFENGEVHLEGPRIIRVEEDGSAFIVDPEETISENELSGRYILVRAKTIFDTTNGARRETKLSMIRDVTGIQKLRIDSASLLAFAHQWTGRLVLAMTALLALVEGGSVLTSLLYALFAGVVLAGVWKNRGLTGPETFRVGLAALTLRPVIEAVLSLLGAGVGPCLGILAWPALAIAMGSLAISRLPVALAPSSSAPPPFAG